MIPLLEQIKKLNEIMKKSATNEISFSELAQQISDIIDANSYVSDSDGNILAYKTSKSYNCEINDAQLQLEKFPADFNELLMSFEDNLINDYTKQPDCIYGDKDLCIYNDRFLTMIPIKSSGKRLGSLVLAKYTDKFTDSSIVVAEYAAAIVAMEMTKIEQEKSRTEMKLKTAVSIALSTLSYTELNAVRHIIDSLQNDECILVASAIAQKANLTRSVISNALRKLESAGLIQTRSLGMKGTYIKIENRFLREELEKFFK